MLPIYLGNKVNVEAVIDKAGTKSAAVDLEGMKEIGLIIPTIDTGDVTFEVSDALDGDFVALKDKSPAALTIVAGTGGFAVTSDDLKGLVGYRFVKVVAASQTTAAVTFIFTGKG